MPFAGDKITAFSLKLLTPVRLFAQKQQSLRYGPHSFAVAGPSTWNALPAPLRNGELTASMSFRRQLKTELYMRAYFSH